MQCAAANLFGHTAVLVVDSFSDERFTFRIKRQQINIIVCAAMQNAAATIDRRVDQGIRGPAVLGLYVVDRLSHFYVRVMPKEHRFRPLPRRPLADDSAAGLRDGIFLAPFDRLAVEWIL